MTEIKIKIQIKHIIALSSANSPADLMNIKLTNKTHASRTNAKAHKTEIKDEELFDLAILAKIREVCKSMTYSSQFGCARQLSKRPILWFTRHINQSARGRSLYANDFFHQILDKQTTNSATA